MLVGAACPRAPGPASPGRGISRSPRSGTPCATRGPVIAGASSARTAVRRTGGSHGEPSRRRAASPGARKGRGLADPNGSTRVAPHAGAALLRGTASGWRDDRPTCPAPASGHGPAWFPRTRRARATAGKPPRTHPTGARMATAGRRVRPTSAGGEPQPAPVSTGRRVQQLARRGTSAARARVRPARDEPLLAPPTVEPGTSPPRLESRRVPSGVRRGHGRTRLGRSALSSRGGTTSRIPAARVRSGLSMVRSRTRLRQTKAPRDVAGNGVVEPRFGTHGVDEGIHR